MELKKYLEEKNINATQFAELLGVEPSTTWRIVNKKQLPRPELASLIAKVTNGAVTPNDFYGIPPFGKAVCRENSEVL